MISFRAGRFKARVKPGAEITDNKVASRLFQNVWALLVDEADAAVLCW